MSTLASQECTACRADSPQVGEHEADELLAQLPEWQMISASGVPQLERTYKFRNFADALAFTNKVGELAESLNHHPDISLGWGYVRLIWYTHAISGLHQNDFICAAKSDQLFCES
ncbi:4a-hydroxytetrahydrobiopterin dehydratase [Pontibacterium sp.]|uniref:4a-hydroxytetrahydrobiopterin dehydratase n=1 Tax=Pontibacterium sp. TaxID=2036026 RepID=UPI0035164940